MFLREDCLVLFLGIAGHVLYVLLDTNIACLSCMALSKSDVELGTKVQHWCPPFCSIPFFVQQFEVAHVGTTVSTN